MRIKEISDTHINHGYQKEIIMKCTIDHEVEFKCADIIKILKGCASDSMSKVINEIGKNFNLDQMAECYAADDLNEHGKRFIEDMFYFITSKSSRLKKSG
ncbi:MAG: hypothetical protein DRH26_02260 [Deltaproteobacteria bacterium]|nr:MAG: hypothetical protein DRH26_02260 [Deltaproteobacteria bacterium]